MSQIEVFNNEEFGSIRVIEENGKYLFCGLDAAKALGYKDTVNAPQSTLQQRWGGVLPPSPIIWAANRK